jgi:hypothetical protein
MRHIGNCEDIGIEKRERALGPFYRARRFLILGSTFKGVSKNEVSSEKVVLFECSIAAFVRSKDS